MAVGPEHSNPRLTKAWPALETSAAQVASLPMLLTDDERYAQCSLQLDELCFDFSRQQIDGRSLQLLRDLARQQHLGAHIEALFGGQIVNGSEHRAALHTALRAAGDSGLRMTAADGDAEIAALVAAELARFLEFAEAVRQGHHLGHGGAPIKRVINIGIGGSDLGPRMVTRALAGSTDGPAVGFVAGLDGIELAELLQDAVPAETLFVVCSKTFTTLETRTNADTARAWLLRDLPEEAVATNFAAVSVNDPALDEFGIAPALRFRMWDWVGGRYSVWSAIGLAAAIALGSAAFTELLAGAARMDEHFRSAPFEKNIPVLSGLLGIWNRNFLGNDQNVILPYDQRLDLLPDYLQQLVMESLGKSVRQDGSAVDYATGGSLWGGPGSNSQHSFAQWLHQGCASAYVDYIGTVNGAAGIDGDGHLQALGNMLAQAEALANGQALSEVQQALQAAGMDAAGSGRLAPQKVHPGSRPSSILLLKTLSPRNVGMLLALYEHQVFVQGTIWGINPFDQWGVELGKVRAREYSAALVSGATGQLPGIGRQILDWQKN